LQGEEKKEVAARSLYSLPLKGLRDSQISGLDIKGIDVKGAESRLRTSVMVFDHRDGW